LSSCVVAAIVVASFAVHTGRAQTWTSPRTPWGDPDFQGIWNYATMTPLERPRDVADKDALTDDEAAAYEQRTNQRQATTNNTAGPDWWDPGTRRLTNHRTSLIIDPANGRIPDQTPEARARAAATAEQRRLHPADEPANRGLSERCITFGVPRFQAAYSSVYQIVQGPTDVVFDMETIHDARVIPLDGKRHLPDSMRQWLGNSRGHWEGETLVVETQGFSPKSNMLGSSSGLHLVERFTRVAADTLQYDATMSDPSTWTRPWTARILFKRTTEPLIEYACHEGNHGMAGILAGARKQEAEQAGAKP